MSRSRSTIAEDYIAKLFGHETPHHVAVREALARDGKEGINIGMAEGSILQFLLRAVRAKIVVEIGTLYGYSTLYFAEALPEDGRVISLEKSVENYQKAKELLMKSPWNSKIELHNGDATEILKSLKVQPDVVFIDADKPGYPRYLNWALENVRVGGLIIGDNTFLFGHLIGAPHDMDVRPGSVQAMTQFNERLAKHPDFCATIIPTHEGMTVAVRLK